MLLGVLRAVTASRNEDYYLTQDTLCAAHVFRLEATLKNAVCRARALLLVGAQELCFLSFHSGPFSATRPQIVCRGNLSQAWTRAEHVESCAPQARK